MDGEKKVSFRVREFDMESDLAAVEELERRCQVGLCGDDTAADDGSTGGSKMRKKTKRKKKGMSLCVEQVGDPLARVRHAPEHVMLVSGGLTKRRTILFVWHTDSIAVVIRFEVRTGGADRFVTDN
jgi:hypothetical protein